MSGYSSASNPLETMADVPHTTPELESLLRDILAAGKLIEETFGDVRAALDPVADLRRSVNHPDVALVPNFQSEVMGWIDAEIAAVAALLALRKLKQPITATSPEYRAGDGVKTIFLGFPFKLDGVRPAVERAAEGIARVLVASDYLRGKPLLHKIEEMMAAADLCIFDLTLHNPNVAAEFGIAHGRGHKYAILYCTDESFNPKPDHESSVFSDVKGWDSVQYSGLADLESQLRKYLPELLSAPTPRVAAPLHIPEATQIDNQAFSVKPIMHLRLGSGEGGPNGHFINGLLKNVGRGIAREPKLFLPGIGDVPVDRLIKPGEELVLRLPHNPYLQRFDDATAIVTFEDEIGNKYEQRGTIEQLANADSSMLSYGITGLGAVNACVD